MVEIKRVEVDIAIGGGGGGKREGTRGKTGEETYMLIAHKKQLY